MHPYATDSNERKLVTSGLAVLSVGVAWILSRALAATSFSMPWWFDAPSTMGFFGLFYALFDRILWRGHWLSRFGVVKVPVLSGRWLGHIHSSYDEHATAHDVSVEIKQTWTELSVVLESSTSKSHTLVAAVQVKAPEGVVLSYQYRNDPKPAAVGTMQIHYGTARLTLSEGRVLEGDYYSGRGRQNYGSIRLEKQNSHN